MTGPEPADRVKATDLGEGRGISVTIPRSHLREMGVNPDSPLEVSRSVMGEDSYRLRFYEEPEE